MSEEILKTPPLNEVNDVCDDDCTYKGLEKVAGAIDGVSEKVEQLKLYHTLGDNDDGAVSQDVVTDELNKKFDKIELLGGETGQSPIRSDGDVDYAFEYVTLIPEGGTTGQVLKKRTNANYDTVWEDESGGGGSGHGIPAGGTAGQHLTKIDSSDYNADWTDEKVPTGGLAGQILKKRSNNNYDLEWGNATALPAGGEIGDSLLKNSNEDYDFTWGKPEGSVIVLKHNDIVLGAWETETAPYTVNEKYKYRARIGIDGIDDEYVPIVSMKEEDATSSIFAKSVAVDANAIYIFAKEIPDSCYINSITLIKSTVRGPEAPLVGTTWRFIDYPMWMSILTKLVSGNKYTTDGTFTFTNGSNTYKAWSNTNSEADSDDVYMVATNDVETKIYTIDNIEGEDTWENDSFRTITITSVDENYEPILRDWLKLNADKES